MSFFKTLKMQLSVLFTRKLYLITFIILFFMNISAFITKMVTTDGLDKYYAIPASMAFLLNWSNDGRSIIFMVAILAAIPFCTSYAEDHKARLCSSIFTRTSSYNYYFAKLTSVFVVTFLCIAIPFIINQLLCMSYFPVENITSDASRASSQSGNFFNNLRLYAFKNVYINHIHLYNFIYTMIFSAFWGLLSTFSCAVSFCLPKLKSLVILIPFLLSQLATYVENIIFGGSWSPDRVYFSFGDYILPQSYGFCMSPMVFVLYIVGFIALSIMFVMLKVRAERVKAS